MVSGDNMTTPKKPAQEDQKKPRSLLSRLLGGALRLAIAALIIGGAILVFRYYMNTSPRAKRKKSLRQAKLVQVIPLHKDDCVTVVTKNGTVVPAQQVTLQPQVNGHVVEISPDVIPGCVISAGQKLFAIDPRDYDIMVQQRRSDVATASKNLKVEQGNQAVARQEYELLGEVIAEEDRELVLREPQLASAQGMLESAEAALQRARLDRARCDIAAPFNAIVQNKHVDLGATVGTNTQLATLIGTDEAWINVRVPIDKLKWIIIPQSNGDRSSKVAISSKVWGADQHRAGRVVRLHGEIETQGRMAKLLVVVEDPFCLKPENEGKPQLLIGSYVSAKIEGSVLPSVFPIEESHLRDDQTVWIMDDEGKLQIRQVEVAFSGPGQYYISGGLTESEQLVVTDIAAPIDGMPLRIAQADGEKSKDLQVARDGGQHE